jgi:hypothetical protein
MKIYLDRNVDVRAVKNAVLLGCVPKPFFYRFSSSFEPLFDLNDKGHIT